MLDAFEKLLDDGGDLWTALGRDGWLDALKNGVPLPEVEPLFRALGRRGIDLPVTDAMVARAAPLPATRTGCLLAVLAAAEIAGGGERLLDMSLAHAGARRQFGKPLASFQAIQQQLAVLAEQVVLVRIAAQFGCAGGLDVTPERAAVAKHTASAAVPVMAGIAHAVHGAIGITAEFPLARITGRLHALRMAYGSEGYWARVLGAARLAAGGESLVFVRGLEG